MTTLTGGVVKYERTVKTGDYENKKLVVELSFNFEDGAGDPDAIVDRAIELVHTKLGIRTAPKPAADASKVVNLATVKADAVKEATDLVAARDTKAADAAKEAYAAKEAAKKTTKAEKEAAKQQIQTAPEDRKEPAGDDVIDMGDDNLFAADGPVEITDKDLQDKITARNGVIKSAQAIKKLIGKYAPTAGQIPQVQRAEFLEKLAVLTPAV